MTAPAHPTVRLDTGLEKLLEHAFASAPGGRDGRVLATVVATAGSTYRKAGARMLVEPDGMLVGLLSGGCLEGDLREHAGSVRETGLPHIVEYDMRGEDDLLFGLGAGCEGAMRILLEPAGPGTPAAGALAHARAASAEGRPTALAVVHEGPAGLLGTRGWPGMPGLEPALADACAATLELGISRSLRWNDEATPTEAWVQYLAPPPALLVCGGGPDAEPLVRFVHELGWPVTVVDHRPAYASAARFPRAQVRVVDPSSLAEAVALGRYSAAVVMSHHLPSDAAYLRALADSGLPYVGLLGPRPRREKLLAELGPVAAHFVGRLRGPVGLDLGAATPEAIALAIAAELHATLAGRAGGPCTIAASPAAGVPLTTLAGGA